MADVARASECEDLTSAPATFPSGSARQRPRAGPLRRRREWPPPQL